MLLKRQLEEIENCLERLEERYITEEITQELFVKYQEKFRQEKLQIVRRLQQPAIGASNLESCIDAALNYAENLRQMWADGSFAQKQRLQYLLFPQGLRYSKRSDTVRTVKINTAFLRIAHQSQELAQNKNGIPELNIGYARLGSTWQLPTTNP